MRHIDLETWPRREHFKFFNTLAYPHFNLCANMDLTTFYPFVKQRGISFTVAVVYVLARAANAVQEFRHRIRGDEVVEHEIVHPSTTLLTSEELITFCMLDYVEDFSQFAAQASERIAYVREHPGLDDEGRDDLLFLTGIPWVSFTSLMHPLQLQPADSVPRLAWGKRFEEGKTLKMPLSVQAHHALMDGLHMGRFYNTVEGYLQQPEAVLGEG